MKNRPVFALLAVFALIGGGLLAGCGGDDSDSGGSDAEAVVEDFYAAVEDGDGDAACENFSEESLQQVDEAGFDCGDLVTSGQFGDFEEFEIRDSEEDGDSATVTVAEDDEESEVPLIQDDGEWKIDLTEFTE